MLTLESLAACSATLTVSSAPGAERAPDPQWLGRAPDLGVATPPTIGGSCVPEATSVEVSERQERRAYVNAFAAFFG